MTEIKAIIAHTYIGSLIQACKNEQVDILTSMEDDAFGAFTKTSVDIQKHNWPDVHVVGHKSQWIQPQQVENPEKTFVIAHPPCAGSSQVTPAHARGGLDNPKSAFHVTGAFMKYAYVLNAAIIAVESVPGTWKICGGDLKKLRDMYGPGYGVFCVMEESRRYGCVSIRKRMWHVHYRKDLFPNGLVWEQKPEAKRSLREALANTDGLPDMVISPVQQKLYTRYARLFEALPQGQYANTFLRMNNAWDLLPEGTPIKQKKPGKNGKAGDFFVFYESLATQKLSWDRPAPTITGSTIVFHPEEQRPLTSREYLRINGVPDTFSFPPNMHPSKHVTWIGKTVTISMAQWVIWNIKNNLAATSGINMRLKDGDVLDYTKGSTPYVDERFLHSDAPVAAEAPTPAPLPPSVVATINHPANYEHDVFPEKTMTFENIQHFEEFIPPPELQEKLTKTVLAIQGLDEDAALDGDTFLSDYEKDKIGWPYSPGPGLPQELDMKNPPKPEPLQRTIVTNGSTLSETLDDAIQNANKVLSKIAEDSNNRRDERLAEKIKNRIDTLVSLDMNVAEVNAQIKALRWVLELI